MTDEMSAIYLTQMLHKTHEVRVNPIIHFIQIKYACVCMLFFVIIFFWWWCAAACRVFTLLRQIQFHKEKLISFCTENASEQCDGK